MHICNSWDAMPPVSEQMAMPGNRPAMPQACDRTETKIFCASESRRPRLVRRARNRTASRGDMLVCAALRRGVPRMGRDRVLRVWPPTADPRRLFSTLLLRATARYRNRKATPAYLARCLVLRKQSTDPIRIPKGQFSFAVLVNRSGTFIAFSSRYVLAG
jgi:hypothetical protein